MSGFAALIWEIVAPDRFLLLAFFAGAVLLFTRWRRWGRGIVAVCCGVFVVVAVLPIGDWMLRPLELRFPAPDSLPREVDGIIVLSGAENAELAVESKQPVLSETAERLTAFFTLARRYEAARLVISDGSDVEVDGRSVGAINARMLVDGLGINPSRIVFEERSRNTYQNGVFTSEAVTPAKGETWILVTSAFHMPRAIGVWRGLGWEVIAYPVDFRTRAGFHLGFQPAASFRDVSVATKEWGALVVYRLSGRTPSFFPAPLQ